MTTIAPVPTFAPDPASTPPKQLVPAPPCAAFSPCLSPAERTAEIISETLDYLDEEPPGIALWSGRPGVGKTNAAYQLAQYIAKRNPDSKVPVRFFVAGGEFKASLRRSMRRSLMDLHEMIVPGALQSVRKSCAEKVLCEDIVAECRDTGTRLIVVDEAGTKSADELRGLSMIADEAVRVGYRLHLLWVATDEINPKVGHHEVVRSRTRLDLDFEPWTIAQVGTLLDAVVHRYCGKSDVYVPTGGRILETLHEWANGDLRLVLSLATRYARAAMQAECAMSTEVALGVLQELVARNQRAELQREHRIAAVAAARGGARRERKAAA